MSTRKVNPELPEAEKSHLLKLRENQDPRELRERVVALRDANWPLRAMAEAIGVSRMSVHVWERNVRENPTAMERVRKIHDVPQLPMNARGSGVVIKKMKVDVPEHDRERLKSLNDKAKTVRRWSPEESEERKAAAELDKLVVKYRKRGVTPMTIARYAGVSRRAIMARLERIEERQDAVA